MAGYGVVNNSVSLHVPLQNTSLPIVGGINQKHTKSLYLVRFQLDHIVILNANPCQKVSNLMSYASPKFPYQRSTYCFATAIPYSKEPLAFCAADYVIASASVLRRSLFRHPFFQFFREIKSRLCHKMAHHQLRLP